MESEIFWNAISGKDVRFDGAFVFGVKTTGIYCRPSCKARRPLRKNVLFFPANAEAESSGFRACLRCRPTQAVAVDPVVQMVVAACREIDDFPEATLSQLANTAGVSAYHFQRTFKQIMGVSPKKYTEAIKMGRFREEVRHGMDVTDAMYEAGFGSSRGLYAKADESLGMTPSTYKKGGHGMRINYVVTDCELGKMLVARTKRGICSVTFGDDEASLSGALKMEFPKGEIDEDDEGLKNAVDEIIKFLAGTNKRLAMPLDLRATAFQLQVWDLLRQIPYGETRSYTDVAEAIGDKKKVRAVARACAKNRVAVVIPCHRVVASDGKLSGYRWGVDRKRTLLENEQADRSV